MTSEPKVSSRHWAVLGGGMLGMTAALELARAGQKVSLVEAADSPGGLVSPWQMNGVEWDRFYHVILASDTRLLRLLEDIGLSEEVRWGQTNTLFYAGTDLYPLNNVFDYLKLPVLSLTDKVRLGFNIVYGASIRDGRRLEKWSAAEWLSKISGKSAYQKLWRPLLRAKLGSNEPEASAAFIWSIMRRFYGAREGKTRVEQFGYVSGGYSKVITALSDELERLGVELVCNSPVSAVEATEDAGVRVVYGDEQQTYDSVLATFSAPIAARVCSALTDQEQSRLNSFLYQGVVCVSMLLRRALGSAYLTYITDETLPFTTIIEMSSLVDRELLGGHHLVYLPKYVPSHDPFLKRTDEEIIDEFIAGVCRMYPDFSREDIVSIHVARTPYVAPVMTRNYSSMIPAITTSVPQLYMISSAQLVQGSSSVEETIRLVYEAMPALLGQQDPGRG